MVSYTNNHGFQLFADDETPWEHRTDFTNLDTAVEVRDTNAERSNYAAKVGAKYLATDTGDLYLGNGSSWAHLGVIDDAGVDVQDTGGSAGRAHTLNFDSNLSATVTNGVANIDSVSGGGGTFGTATDPVAEITNTHYREITNEASVSGNYTIDLTTANVHKLTLTGNTTLSFTGDHQDLTTGCTVIIQQDATGGHSLDWGSDIYWPAGAVPTLSTDANKRHKLVFESVAGEWEGAVVAENLTFVGSNTIDDFEWGGPVGDRYEGATAQYSIATAHPTVSGSYALEGVAGAAGQRYELFSQDESGLPNNPTRGDSFGGWIRASTLTDIRSGLIFGVQDTNNYYVARVTFDSTAGSELQIATRIGGTYSSSASDPLSLSANTYYDIQINWGTDNTITVTLVDQSGTTVGSVSWTDTSATFGSESGFGYYIYEGGTVDGATYFDDARII